MKKILILVLTLFFLLQTGCKNYTHGIYEISIEANLIENNSVGNEWSIIYNYNEEKIESGYKILKLLNEKDNFNLKIIITEIDNFPDIANEEISILLQNEESKTSKITITENKGQYKDSIAIWEIKISAKCVKKLCLS